MTVLGRYLAGVGQPSMFESEPAFDELAAPDGTVRPSWAGLASQLAAFAETDLALATSEVARLLEDDGVSYTPTPASAISILDRPLTAEGTELARPRPWRLDPLPLVVDASEWSSIEAGVVQRAELLSAVMSDLYGAQRLLAARLLPAAAVLDHDEFLRPLVGTGSLSSQPLFLLAADLGRDASGAWKVMADRTQAPSGAGYAMENRRVVSRVLPQLYHQAHLQRLTPFFHAMRMALVDAAPRGVEDPKVVVLSPGPLSETAFDQAFVASLLGFPLVEGSDLTVRQGRVWLRSLGRLEQVHVILRRVDSTWSDALELRAGSRLGVTGLVTAVRQGNVSVVNGIGSGVLENPALLPYLPGLCERLLGEPLRLPSVDTWWCGDEASLGHVLASLEHLVIRPISRNAGRSVLGSALTRTQRADLASRIAAAPHRYVGQEVLRLSSAPSSDSDTLVRRNVVLRAFAVQHGGSYTAMPGGLARVTRGARDGQDHLVTPPGGGVAKDVWVVSPEPLPATAPSTPPGRVASAPAPDHAGPGSLALAPPRVLSDLYWVGRYAERAEDLLRLLLAARTVAIETDLDVSHGDALASLLHAVTHVSTTYPGFLAEGLRDASALRSVLPSEFRSLLLDRRRPGSAAQAVAGLTVAAQGVRDQLSADVWMVLAEVERAQGGLGGMPPDQGLAVTETSERMLAGLLALAGIVSENMVRDSGWYLLDTGRGLERALQLVTLLEVTLVDVRPPETGRMVVEAVMTAAESIVTFRRRYRGRTATEAVVELLVVDEANPRSVRYQLSRIGADLRAMPDHQATSRPLRLVQELVDHITAADLAALADGAGGERVALRALLSGLSSRLRALAAAIDELYLRQPPSPQPLSRSSWSQGGLS